MATLPQSDIDLSRGVVFQDQPSPVQHGLQQGAVGFPGQIQHD